MVVENNFNNLITNDALQCKAVVAILPWILPIQRIDTSPGSPDMIRLGNTEDAPLAFVINQLQ